MSYKVKIARERFRADDMWVARDDRGCWIAYGAVADARATEGRGLAEFLFHDDEVGKVEVVDGVTVAEILELWS